MRQTGESLGLSEGKLSELNGGSRDERSVLNERD